MWGVQGTLQAPHLSAATGLRLSSPASKRVERVHTRIGRLSPGNGDGHVLVIECKDEGVSIASVCGAPHSWSLTAPKASRSRVVVSPALWCIQPAISRASRASTFVVGATSNEGDEAIDSATSGVEGANSTPAAKNSISEKRSQAEAEVKKGQRTAIVTGAISVLLGVGYLVLIQLLDTRGVILVPPPPEAFYP